MRTSTRFVTLSSLLLLSTLMANASDWTQFRGPRRSGISTETAWSADWGIQAPKTLWSVQAGESYASTLIAEGRAYFTGSNPMKDSVYCLDAETGKEIWKVGFDHVSRKAMAVADPRSNGLTSTPLLHENRLFVVSREAEVFCLDARSGKTLWRTELLKETGVKMPYFGVASSPIIEKNLLIFNVGASGAALDWKTGKVVWKSTGTGGYASPSIYSRAGKREVALFGSNQIAGVEAMTGNILWTMPWKERQFSAPSADPILIGENLFVTSNTDGGYLLKLEGAKPTPLWQTRNMASDFTNPILYQGYLYGNNRGKIACMDAKTGDIKWEAKGLGQGCLLIAGGKIIAQTERGELIVAEASPTKYTELARTKLFDGKDFVNSAGYIVPTLVNGRLYCRVPAGTLLCLDLRGK